ncbi:D-alanyl-D-alanine carboxypeptidase family protein [Cellulosimicrobium aquatile]|uniref:D-alanyl-D-alanine carboxypeptidase family protein n=1 Tax=Cellulosimicrobium aquatile TaxID=1612203 RepID=UPI0014595080|nr:PASTA domain-containing protein [Cellulosimicrobium aquatile]
MSTTAEHEGADDAPVTPEPAPAAAVGPELFGRRARAVSHVLISSALAITLAAALAGSAQPRPGASFFAQETATATQVAALSSTLGAGLDEGQQLDGAIEVLATANALDDGHVSPPVEQARAELGMLLATYLAQQDAARRVPAPLVPDGDLDLDESLDGAQVPELPEPLGPGAGDGTDDTTTGTDGETDDPATDRPAQQPATVDAAGDVATDAVRTAATPTAPSPSPTSSPSPSASTDPSPSDSPSPGGTPSPAPGTSTPLDPTAPGGTGSAGDAGSPGDRTLPEDEVPAPDGVAPGELDGSQDPADGSADSGDGGHAEGDDHAHGDVTLEDVLASATTLAELLGTDLVPVGVVPAAGATALAGTTLAERLAEVVERYAGSTAQYQNGRIPPEALCALDFAPGKTLRCDAAEQLEALAAEFEKEFGYALKITDAYRPYDEQVRLKAVKPYLAAVPGTSQHGWGLAIDVGGNVPSGTSLEYVWLRTHGPDYGWDNPAWARPNGSKPEPWHFEFFAAGKMPTRYTPAESSAPSTPQKPAGPSAPAPKPTTPAAPQPPAPTTPKPPAPTTPEPSNPGPSNPGPSNPEPSTVTVPGGLVGRSQAEVEAALSKAQLKVSVTTTENSAAAGTVLSVDPGSGATVAVGSTVAIVVSSGPPEPEPEPEPEPTGPEPSPSPTEATPTPTRGPEETETSAP